MKDLSKKQVGMFTLHWQVLSLFLPLAEILNQRNVNLCVQTFLVLLLDCP